MVVGTRVGGGPRPVTTRRSAKTTASTSSTTRRKRPGSRRPARWDVGITRPGTGPNGETVVGDSERALQLFYFKHNISEAGARADAAAPAHRRGATARPGSPPTSPTSRFSNRVQGRYTQEFPDDTITLPGTGSVGRYQRLVSYPPRQTQARGVVLGSTASGSLASPGAPPSPRTMPKLSYEVQLNWAAVMRQRGGAAAATSAPSSRTPTSPGTRRAWASFASCSDSTRCRSAGRR